jgi:tetratricopeptide (TPR) repeat protein
MVVAVMVVLPTSAAAQEPPLPELEAVVALLESGRLERAESELRRVLAYSESAAARDLLGVALSGQGRFEEAEQQFSRATQLAPDLLPAREHLGRLLLQQGRAEQALNELRAAARLGPLERDLTLWLADVELSQGNDSQAEVQLRSLAERFQSVRALLELARLHARRGQSQRSAEAVQRALDIAPNSEEVLTARARVSLSVQAPVLAIEALRALTRMHPTVAEHTSLLGVALLQIGELDGAIEALQRSLELEPNRPRTLIALGSTFSSQKRFEEAKAMLRRSLQLDPENTEALAVLAEAEEGLGQVELAEEHAANVLAREPDHVRALVAIGLIRMAQERYEEARDLFLRAVTKEPNLPKGHYQLSLAFARLGDRERSRKHLELYRTAKRENDDRLVELRTKAGIGNPGMGPR